MVEWVNNLTLPAKAPNAEDDYLMDFTDWLNGSEIASHSVTVSNVTLGSSALGNSNTAVTMRLTGGTDGDVALVTVQVTTDDAPARVDERSFSFRINQL